MSSMRPSGEKSRRSKLRKPTVPFSIALPTTPTLTAASTASGKTQNTSMCFMGLAFGGSHHELPRFKIHVRDVFERERNIGILMPSTDHEYFVGGGLERIAHHAENLASIVDRRQSDEICHVEFALFRRVEVAAAHQEFFALQGACIFPAPYAFHVDQKPLRRLSGSGDAPPRTTDYGLHALPEVSARAEGPNPQSSADPVRSDHDPDWHRIHDKRSRGLMARKPRAGSGFSRLPTFHSLLPDREAALQSGTSTETRFPNFTEAAFRTVRIARIVRPWRPITRPMSSGATLSSRSTRESVSVPETSTWSGSSTSERARTASKFSNCAMSV